MPPAIPWYITLIVIITDLTIVAALWRIIGSARAGLLLAAWLASAFLFAPTLLGPTPLEQEVIPPVVRFAAVALVAVLVALALSPNLRRAIAAAPLASVIGVQVYRAIGAVFLILLAQGKLPAHFALPAGWGDVAVGLAAPLVAMSVARGWRGSRPIAVAWNVLGLLDLVVAVGMGSGLLVPLLAPDLGRPPAAAAMGYLPMILVPAFAVPVSVLLHVLALRDLRQARINAAPVPTPANS